MGPEIRKWLIFYYTLLFCLNSVNQYKYWLSSFLKNWISKGKRVKHSTALFLWSDTCPLAKFYSAGDRMWPVPYFVFPDFTISQWTCFTKSFSKTKCFYSKHQEESGVKQASYLSTPLPPTCQLISSIVFKKWTLSEFPGGLVLLPLLLGLLLWHMFHP